MTEKQLLEQMSTAYHALQRLGFNDICYAKTANKMYEVIEPGSSGLHRAFFTDKDPAKPCWTKRSWWIDGNHPSRPILFRELPPDPQEEQ